MLISENVKCVQNVMFGDWKTSWTEITVPTKRTMKYLHLSKKLLWLRKSWKAFPSLASHGHLFTQGVISWGMWTEPEPTIWVQAFSLMKANFEKEGVILLCWTILFWACDISDPLCTKWNCLHPTTDCFMSLHNKWSWKWKAESVLFFSRSVGRKESKINYSLKNPSKMSFIEDIFEQQLQKLWDRFWRYSLFPYFTRTIRG